jgi:hypothetical protein
MSLKSKNRTLSPNETVRAELYFDHSLSNRSMPVVPLFEKEARPPFSSENQKVKPRLGGVGESF